jgi:2,6-dihydroxypyridine 3-monooxygenase
MTKTDQNQRSGDRARRLRVVVVGGSLGGLCAGLALRCVGCDVEIFERSSSELKDRGAGLVVQMELLQYLERHGIATREAISVPSRYRQYLAREGGVTWGEASYQLMTAWNTVYRQLRDVFPDEHYHHSHKLVGFEQNASSVIARFENSREEICDLLVGADGANSTCRSQLLPDVSPQYAGYVAWRGVVEENAVATSVAGVFAEKFTFFQMPNSHILCYLIPGSGGEVMKGKRRLNWVWYWNVQEGEPLRALMTDKVGLFRGYSVPQGAIREDLAEQQRAVAERVLPEVFQQLVKATKEPFVQPIFDLSVPRMVFGRVCLLGDAAFVPRPHTAASTSKAVTNAITLAEGIGASQVDVVAALEQWESAQLELGSYLKVLGQTLGNRSQFGRP